MDTSQYNLTERQQQMIRVASYIQSRSERADISKYPKAHHFMRQWYCHASVAAIVLQYFHKKLLCKKNLEKFTPNFLDFFAFENPVYDPGELNKATAELPHPTVIHIIKVNGDVCTIYHTVLTLGVDEDGMVILWEKEASDKPFRISTISQVVLDYPGHCWGAVIKRPQ